MSEEQVQRVARRWHMDVVQGGRGNVVDEIMTPDVVIHANGQTMTGRDGARGLAEALRTALPDLRVTHEEIIVSGDRAAIRWTADGTHHGHYFGIPATGAPMHIEGLDWVRMEGDTIAELWIAYDSLGPLASAGAVAPVQRESAGGTAG